LHQTGTIPANWGNFAARRNSLLKKKAGRRFRNLLPAFVLYKQLVSSVKKTTENFPILQRMSLLLGQKSRIVFQHKSDTILTNIKGTSKIPKFSCNLPARLSLILLL